MFKSNLKKTIIPITIVVLTLVVGISLFFNYSSVYKKKTIVNTYQLKEKNETVTSSGEDCKELFGAMNFAVNVKQDSEGDTFNFIISSETKREDYKNLLKKSGYKSSINYNYVVNRVKFDAKGNVSKVLQKEDSGNITINNSTYSSSKTLKSLSTKYNYQIIISSTAWIRDKAFVSKDGKKQVDPVDPGYYTCGAGAVKEIINFSTTEMKQKKLEKTEYNVVTKVIPGDTETNIDIESRTENVNNYSVRTDCTLPENAQANQYLFNDTNVYPGKKDDSATFKKYTNEFNAAYAKDKNKAITVDLTEGSYKKDSDGNYVEGGQVVDNNVALNLKCDYKLDVNDVKNVADGIKYAYNSKGLKYYKYDESNTHYFKATKTMKYEIDKYVYHTGVTLEEEQKNNYCSRTCTEIVKVEYGSPAYVEAGMCFQYRMKVSSIVQCKYDGSNLKKPKDHFTICRPEAFCFHGSYKAVGKGSTTQAGPSEDYEACINKCDGGKYTKECSNVCYNIVYGNKNDANLALYSNLLPTNTSACRNGKGTCVRDQFTYFRYVNGSYQFNSGNRGLVSSNAPLPRGTITGLSMEGYYVQHLGSSTYYMVDGIPRANYGDHYCGEYCGWEAGNGCNPDPTSWYFEGDTANPNFGKKVAQADYDENIAKYESVLNECKAKATCVSSTATYTIKTKFVDASKTNLEVTEAKFPFSKEKTETKSPATSCALSMKDRSPVISFGGCYVNSDANRWYQGEMTFPGSYQDYKHNSVNVNPVNPGSDILLPGRMCINGNQGNTNAVWAKKFDNVLGALNSDKNFAMTETQVNNYWKDTFKGNSKGYTAESKNSVNGYNIYGVISDFGYFKWKFQISCFYALYDSGTCGKDEISCSDCKGKTVCVSADEAKNNPLCKNTCPPDDTYTIRSFNASDPLNTTVSNRESTDVQNREDSGITGYNWTRAAKIEHMGYGYNNDPEALAQDIINNQNTIFTGTPNYVIHLDTSTIKNIKNYNKKIKNGYKTFNDKNPSDPSRVNKAGVKFYYSSDFLHNSAIFTSPNNSIPGLNDDIYQCNYYVNNKCVTLKGGE